ncbi:hypothetical protein Aduo_008845 [Ancylostoma duodenale]
MSATKSSVRERLLHEYQLGHSAAVGRRNVCAALGQDVLKKSTAKFWYRKFREGCTEVKDGQRAGRPRSINRALVVEAIEDNPTFSTRMLASSFHCSHTIVKKILYEAGFRVRQGKWVPHDLTALQRKRRFECVRDLLDRHRKQPFLDRIVTCDETWIAFDNRRISKQWLRPHQRPIPVPKPNLGEQKVMLCVRWWVGGIIYWELVASGHTVDADIYSMQLQRVNDKIRQAGLRHLFRRGPILQQDNARPHIAHQTLEKIKELGWELLPHPPYSPDAAPSDYHLFRSLQHYLAGKRLTNVEEVKDRLTRFFESKPAQFYRNGIEKLPEIWRRIEHSRGDYVD